MTENDFINKVAYCMSLDRAKLKMPTDAKDDYTWACLWLKNFKFAKCDNINNKNSKVFYEWFKDIK